MNRARRTYPRSRTPWSRWWPEHRRFLEIRACATTLWKKRSAGAMKETRARGPFTAPNAPNARPLRASPRVPSSARAALPRPEARPRVPRAVRPPARVTSKKTPRRVRNRAFANNVSLEPSTDPLERRALQGSKRRKAFHGASGNLFEHEWVFSSSCSARARIKAWVERSRRG